MHQLGEKDIMFIGNLNNGLNYEQLFDNSISSNFDNMNVIGNGKFFVFLHSSNEAALYLFRRIHTEWKTKHFSYRAVQERMGLCIKHVRKQQVTTSL